MIDTVSFLFMPGFLKLQWAQDISSYSIKWRLKLPVHDLIIEPNLERTETIICLFYTVITFPYYSGPYSGLSNYNGQRIQYFQHTHTGLTVPQQPLQC